MAIRCALASDIREIMRIRLAVLENQLSDPKSISADLIRSYIEERGRGWVFEVESQICGFAIADLESNSVWALFIDPGYEGQGIGQQLHTTMLEWFRSKGVMEIFLSTDPGTRAARFYRAAGWNYTGLNADGEATFKQLL